MPSTPESEETRVTDAEVEAAAKALHNESGYPPSRRSPNLAYWRVLARAALEAAAALHPPREGAEGEIENERDWWAGEIILHNFAVGEHEEKGCRGCARIESTGRILEILSTTEAALATTIEQRDQAEHQAAAAEAALAESRGEATKMREALDVAADELEHNIVRYDDHEWPRHADGICAKCVVDAALEAPHEST